MKTDPRPYSFIFSGLATITLDAAFNELLVKTVSGGSVKRGGVALLPGNTLATGDVLSVTPDAEKGTTTLNCEKANQEFSGLFADLQGLSVDPTTDPPKLIYQRTDGAFFEIVMSPSAVVVTWERTVTVTSWGQRGGDPPPQGGVYWLTTLYLPSGDPKIGKKVDSARIYGGPQDIISKDLYPDGNLLQLALYEFYPEVEYSTSPINIYMLLPESVTPAQGWTVGLNFKP